MHGGGTYDVFLTDAFATGVIVYAASLFDYPWAGTAPSSCKFWSLFVKHGFAKMVERRRLRQPRGERLIKVMSQELINLIAGLVDMNVSERLCLGEACFRSTGRSSVLSSLWLAKDLDGKRPCAKKDHYGSGCFASSFRSSC
jgi:hypothetical protein